MYTIGAGYIHFDSCWSKDLWESNLRAWVRLVCLKRLLPQDWTLYFYFSLFHVCHVYFWSLIKLRWYQTPFSRTSEKLRSIDTSFISSDKTLAQVAPCGGSRTHSSLWCCFSEPLNADHRNNLFFPEALYLFILPGESGCQREREWKREKSLYSERQNGTANAEMLDSILEVWGTKRRWRVLGCQKETWGPELPSYSVCFTLLCCCVHSVRVHVCMCALKCHPQE